MPSKWVFGKNFCFSKITGLVLISHFCEMFIVIFSEINWIAAFLTDSVLKFNTEIDDSNGIRTHNHLVRKRTLNYLAKLTINALNALNTFINTPKTEILHFSIDSPVQCYPQKENCRLNFSSWYLMERFSE